MLMLMLSHLYLSWKEYGKKASELLSEKNAVVKVPGYNDKARMVKSNSGSRPHLVVCKKGGQFACDNTCPNWRSLSICAHAVAAAEDNGDLMTFLTWFRKLRNRLISNNNKYASWTWNAKVLCHPQRRRRLQSSHVLASQKL